MSTSAAPSPSHSRISPRPSLIAAGKSPQMIRQSIHSDEQVRASPGAEATRHQSPAPLRSRVIESGFHSTSERSRTSSPASQRSQNTLQECRTPHQQGRSASSPYTPSAAPTVQRSSQLQRSDIRPLQNGTKPLQALGTGQLSNAALVAQRFGSAGSMVIYTARIYFDVVHKVTNYLMLQATGTGKPSALGARGISTPIPEASRSILQRPFLTSSSGIQDFHIEFCRV